jgi:tudor domain-containing protein 3
VTTDKGFKSLQSKQKEQEDNSEFIAQRQDAIAEATKVGTRKTFGGGTKTLVDANVQKIIDKGYTEEQATTALKFARNNVEKALSNLKRREERQQHRASSNDYESRESSERKDKRGGDREGRGKNSSDPPPAKPSTGVSLFDFLENKIPESSTAKQSYSHNERFENNISSSFRKFDKESSNKSHQWSQQQQYSSSGEQKSSQNYNKHSSYNSRNDYHGNESSSYRDYKGNNNNYQRGDRDRERERDRDRDSKQSYYQSSHGNNNNYAGKSSSSAGYSKTNQKPSQSSHVNNNHSNNSHYNDASSSSYNNNNNNKGKYGQKPDYQGGSRGDSRKDYNNSYSSTSAGNNSYQHKPRSNEGYQNRENSKPQRNIVESMEKMNLKGNQQQHYKGNDSKYSQSSYPTAGFQSKEGNEQAKNALKTKNIPSQAPNNNNNNNWQQHPAPIPTPPSHVPIQVPVITQAPMKTAPPPPFSNSGVVQAPATHQMHQMAPQPFVQHPVMAMPQPATVFTYQPPPIIMQSVPMQQAPTGLQMKIGDHCLAKYWEDGKVINLNFIVIPLITPSINSFTMQKSRE